MEAGPATVPLFYMRWFSIMGQYYCLDHIIKFESAERSGYWVVAAYFNTYSSSEYNGGPHIEEIDRNGTKEGCESLIQEILNGVYDVRQTQTHRVDPLLVDDILTIVHGDGTPSGCNREDLVCLEETWSAIEISDALEFMIAARSIKRLWNSRSGKSGEFRYYSIYD